MSERIVSLLIKFMTRIGNHKNLTGDEKKKWVLLRLKEEMDYDENLENIIMEVIDYIVLVDSGSIKINPVIKNNLCCFK